MAKHLVIVESPTKAKTISKFLGSDFNIQSSYGHLRDLPVKKFGVDVKNNFKPEYVVARENQKTVTGLKKAAGKADLIYLATDEDREGEAISWHLVQILGSPDAKIKRITFHEITEEAIKEALKNPRQIDEHLVNSQQARRILDRLIGYELSPFLRKKVAKGLSAGRVQSVAVRLIVEREREIQKFKVEEYWTIEGEFKKETANPFKASLHKIDGRALDKLEIKSAQEGKDLVAKLEGQNYAVAKLQKREVKKFPQAPFTTSTLQQEANRRLGFSARQTMRIAQQLYEGVELGPEGSAGLITYMRTDSVNLAEKFLNETQNFIKKEFGNQYSLRAPRRYKTKSKLAQEAHEAVRPTEITRKPEEIEPYLESNQLRLYRLIWQRALACQMTEAALEATTIDLENTKTGHPTEESYTFRTLGSVIKFDGFLKIYPDSLKEIVLPSLTEGEKVEVVQISPRQHFTQPPARYSEASLIKTLEEYGIGRPSTYAPTIATIIERNYVQKFERRLKPTEIAFIVIDLLVAHFPVVVDYQFTAHLENDLDEIAQGKKAWVPVIREFYEPFKANLMNKQNEINKKDLVEEASSEVCPKCGKPMLIKTSRFGKFLACSGFPECRQTKHLNQNGEAEDSKEAELVDQKCAKCGAPLQIKRGRFGEFYGCSKYPDCNYILKKNKTTGVKCPTCGQGEIVQKSTRRGRVFYSCDQYPNCKYALWSKPTGEKCPECKELLVFAKDKKVACSNKACKYSKDLEQGSIENSKS